MRLKVQLAVDGPWTTLIIQSYLLTYLLTLCGLTSRKLHPGSLGLSGLFHLLCHASTPSSLRSQ